MIIKNNSLEVLRTCHYTKNDKLNALVSDNLYMSIVTTNACQCNCAYCINSLTDKTQHMPFEKGKENMAKVIEELGVKECIILGGEPTLYPYLFPLIAFLRGKVRKIGLTTNGIRLTHKSFLIDLIHTGIDFINLSFHNEDFISFKQLKEIYSVFNTEKSPHQKIRINTNVWKGNHDKPELLHSFIEKISECCDEIRISNIIHKDSFSVNTKQPIDAVKLYMSDVEYKTLFASFIDYYKDIYSIIYNPVALGFVSYYLIPTRVPIIVNWNIGSKVSEQICENNLEEKKIHTIKCLVNGEISLSWNENNVIRI